MASIDYLFLAALTTVLVNVAVVISKDDVSYATCTALASHLPAICKFASSEFAWPFRSRNLTNLGDLCREFSQTSQSRDTNGATPLAKKSATPMRLADGFQREDHADYLSAFVYNKNGSGNDRETEITKGACEPVATKTGEMCRQLVQLSRNNGVVDRFEWLCIFTPLTKDGALDLCKQAAAAIYYVCSTSHGPSSVPPETLTPPFPSAKMFYAQTCQQLTPALHAVCTSFENQAPDFFGTALGLAIQKGCATLRQSPADGCDSLRQIYAPVCQKTSLNPVLFFSNFTWICELAGSHYDQGVCRVFATKLAALCRLETANCNATLSPTPFNCKSAADDVYADPKHRCASYFFQCQGGKLVTVGCPQGADYVYDAQLKGCRNRRSVGGCEAGVQSPCMAQVGTSRKWSRPKRVDCDPSLPEPLGEPELHDKVLMRFQGVQRVSTAELTFNCTGKDDGKHANVNQDCPSVYFRCKRGSLQSTMTCEHSHEVYAQKSWFGLVKTRSCVPRKDVPGCQLPACPVYHPLRLDCDPFAEPLPDEAGYSFICTGKHEGYYPDPMDPCAGHFYSCQKGSPIAGRMRCNVLDESTSYVFNGKTGNCEPKEEASWCADYLPPCHKDHRHKFAIELQKALFHSRK